MSSIPGSPTPALLVHGTHTAPKYADSVDPLPVKPMQPETTNTPSGPNLTASTDATILAANASRITFTIYNPLATPLFVRKAGSAASATPGNYDFIVGPSGMYISRPYEWTGALHALCATAGQINVSESV